MKGKASKQIRISSLKRDQFNSFEIKDDFRVLIFFDGEEIRVVEDLCPHMGGSLSKGQFCPKRQAIVCPWHGYEFCTTQLVLKENPNEKIWIKPLAGSEFDKYKTPKYRLKKVKFQVDKDYLYIED